MCSNTPPACGACEGCGDPDSAPACTGDSECGDGNACKSRQRFREALPIRDLPWGDETPRSRAHHKGELRPSDSGDPVEPRHAICHPSEPEGGSPCPDPSYSYSRGFRRHDQRPRHGAYPDGIASRNRMSGAPGSSPEKTNGCPVRWSILLGQEKNYGRSGTLRRNRAALRVVARPSPPVRVAPWRGRRAHRRRPASVDDVSGLTARRYSSAHTAPRSREWRLIHCGQTGDSR